MSQPSTIFVPVSSLILSFLDDESSPVVYSTPPRVDSDGDPQPAQITVQPWGPQPWEFTSGPPPREPDKTRITMYFSIGEAEALARKLLEVVVAAKEGVYSREGHELVEFSRQNDLDTAWRVLGLEDQA